MLNLAGELLAWPPCRSPGRPLAPLGEQLTDRDFAGLLQYQAESELGGGLLRARARCAHDLEAPQELLDHLKRPVVQVRWVEGMRWVKWSSSEEKLG